MLHSIEGAVLHDCIAGHHRHRHRQPIAIAIPGAYGVHTVVYQRIATAYRPKPSESDCDRQEPTGRYAAALPQYRTQLVAEQTWLARGDGAGAVRYGGGTRTILYSWSTARRHGYAGGARPRVRDADAEAPLSRRWRRGSSESLLFRWLLVVVL